MFSRETIHEGMAVYSNDGEKLGKVFIIEDEAFHIEKGFFFPKDYLARFTDIREVTDDRIYLSRDKASLLEGREAWEGTARPDHLRTQGTSSTLPWTGDNSAYASTPRVEKEKVQVPSVPSSVPPETAVVDERRAVERAPAVRSTRPLGNEERPASTYGEPTDEPPYGR